MSAGGDLRRFTAKLEALSRDVAELARRVAALEAKTAPEGGDK